jgi:ribosome-interacting GTPase 1
MLSVSATTGRHLDQLGQVLFDRLDIMRVYSRPPGQDPDLSSPFVMRKNGTVEEFAEGVHKDFYERLKSARVWGTGVFDGQMVGRDHVLHDGDVVELRL